MVDIPKADWKLFGERNGGWKEAHMEKLNKEDEEREIRYTSRKHNPE